MTTTNVTTTAYDFSFQGLDGAPLPLAKFRGKALLVVNTASRCGYTPQLEGLEKLWRDFGAQGLVVLGVPSNDFGGQEPLIGPGIAEFCSVNYGVSFPLTDKTAIKGDEAHPFYRWANEQAGLIGTPRWNFHKYLFDRQGHFVTWFSTMTPPSAPRVTDAISATLRATAA